MSEQINAQQTVQPLTNPSLRQLNDSYATKIAKGEIQVQPGQNKERMSAAEQYDQAMKAKKIAQAERERQELERKLAYLDRSIQSIKEYDYSSGKAAPVETNPQKTSPEAEAARKQAKRKLKEEQEELRKKKELQQKRKAEQQELQEKMKAQQAEKQKALRKEKILENMQRIKHRMEDRQESLKRQGADAKRLAAQKTLYERLEQSFKAKESTVLEQRKKKLADIRSLHRPISIQEIAQHEKSFLQVLKEKQSMRERQRRINNATENYRVTYKSPNYKKVAREEKDIKEDESRIKADKMRQFSQHVRDNFIPVVDQRKRENIQRLLEEEQQRREREKGKKDNEAERVEETRSKGLRYLEQVRQLPKKRDATQQAPQSDRVHYKNYLTHSERSGTSWRSILQSSKDKKEKAIRVQLQSQKLQTSLKLKQEKARVLKGNADQIDQQYYQMIKAKLDLLQTQ